MPCSDVTEVIDVVVDSEDRLKFYSFRKRTCGQGVGVDSLLLDVLGGMDVEALLAISPESFLETWPAAEPIEEFLGLKHLIALQSSVAVLLGRAAGGRGEICAAAEIACEDGDTIITAIIALELITEKIASCGGCKGCGTTRKTKKQVVFN
ncbi:MAG: hypothetical protein L3K26_09830 [Candidatus Hydrogenedentes bacterium]|nr:hypothetical protein [Candidatus Hydrogenedentota bacterium]